MIAIYLLREPDTNRPRYVGQSKEPAKRLEFHKWGGGSNPHLKRWVTKLKRANASPVMQIIYEADTADLANTIEKYFIMVYRKDFPDLMNMTSGGESSFTMHDDVKARISESMKKVMTPEHREHLSNKLKGRKNPNPKGLVEWNKSRKGIPLSAETKAKLSIAHTGRKKSQKEREAMGLRVKSWWLDPEYRKRATERAIPILDKYRIEAQKKSNEVRAVKRLESERKIKEAMAMGLTTAGKIGKQIGMSKTYVHKLMGKMRVAGLIES